MRNFTYKKEVSHTMLMKNQQHKVTYFRLSDFLLRLRHWALISWEPLCNIFWILFVALDTFVYN